MAQPREGFGKRFTASLDTGSKIIGMVFTISWEDLHPSAGHPQTAQNWCTGRNACCRASRVSTVPISVAERICGNVQTSGLKTITLITLCFSFSATRAFPGDHLQFLTRGCMEAFDGLSRDFTIASMVVSIFAVEVIAGQVGPCEEAEADFRRHANANRLFPRQSQARRKPYARQRLRSTLKVPRGLPGRSRD